MGKSKVQMNALKSLKGNILVAVRYGYCLQFALLQFFLLFVNFHPLHPWQWLTTTFNEIFCLGTLVSIIPLLLAVLLYDMLLYSRLMSKKRYYASRFTRLMFPLFPKILLLLSHMFLGLLSACLYASYLPLDYRQFTFECYGGTCLNSRYLFLVFCGISAGFYHFARKYAYQEPDLEFPVIQQRQLVQIRTSLYFTFYTTLWKTLLPTFALSIAYGVINGNAYHIFAQWLRLNTDESMESVWCVLTDLHLLFYAWLLQTHIISNFNLLFRFYCIVFSDQPNFPISVNMPIKFGMEEEEDQVTLAKALRTDETPLVQNLAALQLYKIAVDAGRMSERQEIFSLTSLSDHPYNWHQLSVQCLCLITAFTEELESAVKRISNIKMSPLLVPNYANAHKTTAMEMAQKVLCRQKNYSMGIRRMWSQPYAQPVQSEQVTFLRKLQELPKLNKAYIYKLCCRVPCINYIFGEAETGRTAYLLYNAQYMVRLTQGLAGLCALSLQEDRYGVVQSTLRDIFSVLLKLKFELEKLNNVNLNGKKLDRSLLSLKYAVKRSLYRMCSAFGDYLRDIVSDQQELQQLQFFVTYQEI